MKNHDERLHMEASTSQAGNGAKSAGSDGGIKYRVLYAVDASGYQDAGEITAADSDGAVKEAIAVNAALRRAVESEGATILAVASRYVAERTARLEPREPLLRLT